MQRAADVALLFDAEPVQTITSNHGKTSAQVLLRWATQRNIAVIPKSNNRDRLAQNLDVISFDLSKEELGSISTLDKGLRFNDPGHYLPDYPLQIFA
jgi:D-xylose reductase